jgi:putative transcriptional regulator
MNFKMKSARVEKGLSQADLAQQIGVSRQTILLIEQNQYNPSLHICRAICKALDRTLDDLFWEDSKNGK